MSQRQQERDTPTTSQTTTEPSQPETQEQPTRILRLRGHHTSTGRSVQWAEDVVDNEGLGRKSSKVCCIYHRPKAVDESSDESSSSGSSGSDSDSEPDGARPAGGKKACGHGHNHDHGQKKARGKGKQKRAPSPNAYEKVPKPKPKDKDGGSKA